MFVKELPEWLQARLPNLTNLDWEARENEIFGIFAEKNAAYSYQQILHALRTTSYNHIFKYAVEKLLKAFNGWSKS